MVAETEAQIGSTASDQKPEQVSSEQRATKEVTEDKAIESLEKPATKEATAEYKDDTPSQAPATREETASGEQNTTPAELSPPSAPSTVNGSRQPGSENVSAVEHKEVQQASSSSGGENDLEKGGVVSSSDEEDENIVFWDGDDDPENPYNWPSWRKVINCTLVSSLSFLTPLASSMFAPGVTDVMIEFRSSNSSLGSFVVSIYVLGFAAGPMIFAPLSEIYGRNIIYHCTNVCFLAFIIACAKAPSFSALIAFRFLSGLFGSTPMTNGGGSIADMIHQEKRGVAISAFAVGPLMGPIVGPIAGGYLTQAMGWRWSFWLLAILSGVINIVFFIFARETYAPVLLKRKAARLRKATGNMNLRSKLDEGITPAEYFRRGIVRPLRMLLFSPICTIASLYVAIGYGYLYLMFSSLSPLIKEIYHFGTGASGLAFLGCGIGSMIGVIFFSRLSDVTLKRKAAEEKERAEAEGREPEGLKPEYRLPPLKLGAFLLPIGLFVYGWTAYYEVHWIAPIIGTAFIGAGNLIIFMSFQLYLVDAFTQYSASALASNCLIRSILGAALPVAAFPMYDKLNLGWGNSLLGFIACALIPVPWLILKYGESLRKRFEIKNL